MADDAKTNLVEYSVSEISSALKRKVEDEFGYVRVRGELGRVSRPASGHVYLDLKDDRAVLAGVIWKGVAASMRIAPEEGLEVVATGRMTTFAGQSKYQIIIEGLEPAGVGALMALLEERRKKFTKEGLFDDKHKKPLPWLPDVIGVVTSPSGAVIRDILHRLADRFPRHVLVWPVRVQGETSAAEVAAAIAGFNALKPDGDIPRPDLLIVARGGGSVEDLWGFNEEEVVRAAFASDIPLISAIGHETDWTLLDMVANMRAPTPTAAAEAAVPVRSDLMANVDDLVRRHRRSVARLLEERRTGLRSASRALPKLSDLLSTPRQRLDLAGTRIGQALALFTARHRSRMAVAAARLSPRMISGAIDRHRQLVTAQQDRMARSVKRVLEQASARLGGQTGLMRALGPGSVLARGFALVRDEAGKVIRSSATLQSGMNINIELSDGNAAAVIAGGNGKSKSPVKRKPGKGEDDSGQDSLF